MNDQMQHTRDVALNILKPSQRDIEHGLELHEHALVIESYGLGLRSPVDPDPVNAAIEAGASDRELQDLTEDLGMTRWALTPELRREYREIWQASGVTCTFQNAGEECNDPLRIIKRLARHTYNTDAMPDFLQRVTTPDDIAAAHKAGKRCTYLTCNGIPLAGDQTNPAEELRYIRVFAQLGARMMHLTYNRRNPIGDGCGEPNDAGLERLWTCHSRRNEPASASSLTSPTPAGKPASTQQKHPNNPSSSATPSPAHSTNTSEANPTTSSARYSTPGAPWASPNVPAFLGGSGDIQAFLDHIDYVAKTFGTDAVTIGTDRGYPSQYIAEANRKLNPRPKQRNRWEALWPPQRPSPFLRNGDNPTRNKASPGPTGPSSPSALCNGATADDDIAKIIGGNILRVAREVWKKTQLMQPHERNKCLILHNY